MVKSSLSEIILSLAEALPDTNDVVCTLISIYKLLYNTLCYNTLLEITWFKDGPQKCIDYIEK